MKLMYPKFENSTIYLFFNCSRKFFQILNISVNFSTYFLTWEAYSFGSSEKNILLQILDVLKKTPLGLIELTKVFVFFDELIK